MEEEDKKINYDDVEQTEDGILIFNPFNPLNIEIQEQDIKTILKKYGIPDIVTNIKLYKRAFIHRSYTKRPAFENIQQNIKIVEKPNDCLGLSTKSNERLEFLGDGLLELVTKYYLYRRFPKADEGFMTNKKIAIVKNEAIGRIAYELGLQKWLILSKNAEEKKIRNNLKKLGCLFESFLGAIFLDFNKMTIKDEEKWFENFFVTGPGFQIVQKFIENVFEKHINWTELIQTDDNYKNIIQVKIQKEFKVTPDYIEMGHDMDEGFIMGVFLSLNLDIHNCNLNNYVLLDNLKNFKNIQEYIERNGNILLLMGKGIHKIKKKAEQIACFNALQILDS
jgi:dsRNA-specific ribonuclease